MSQKRQPDEGKGNRPEEKKRRFTWESLVHEVMKVESFKQWLEPVLEPLIRKVVKEEIDQALTRHLASMKWNSGKEMDSFEFRSLKLKFLSNLSLPLFTGARIDGDDPIKVILIDTLTGEIVDSGAESSAEVEIVALEGDFDGDEGGNWTLEDFKNNIVREREGKKPLLTGDVILNLKEGIGLVGEISFTDNSSWTRSRKFRLGARVVDNFDHTRIREAKTEPFVVRDHRGELYKKHHPPSLFDEVWRLEKIGKDGAFHKRLIRENINTVKDFLTLLTIDPPRLRNILGTGMSAKMWEVIIDHAGTCVLDKRILLYYPPGLQKQYGVAFNVVGHVMGLLLESQYVPIDKLSETEKADARSSVIAAFEHWEEVISLEDEASLLSGTLQVSNVPNTSSSRMNETSEGAELSASHKIPRFDFAQPSASSTDISSAYSVGSTCSLDDFALHGIENMGLGYDQPLSFPSQVSNSLVCGTDSMAPAFSDEDHLPFFDTDVHSQNYALEVPADLQSAVDRFMMTQSIATSVATTVANDKAQRRWKKISNVFKWFSIRRIVASKKTHVLRAP